MWGETVASLRYNLRPAWQPETVSGVELVVEPTRGKAIIVTAGDSAAGQEAYTPDVRYERHDVVQALVNGATDQLWGQAERPEWEIWFLLHYLHRFKLHGELARPTMIGKKSGRVASWAERILLPITDYGPDPKARSEVDGPPAIEVDVQRRTV